MSECGARVRGTSCVCRLTEPHEVHQCREPSPTQGFCYGEWKDDGTIVRYPTGERTEAEAMARLEQILNERVFVVPPWPVD